MACLEKFGKPSFVEFVMLRHPPTSRTPNKHIQVVAPLNAHQLGGLREYLREMGKVMNDFSLEDGLKSPCTDIGFCQRVCSFYAPLDYWAIVSKTDPTRAPIKTFALDKAPTEWDRSTQELIKCHHDGCLAKWRQPESGG
jgi:hypothetical protein